MIQILSACYKKVCMSLQLVPTFPSDAELASLEATHESLIPLEEEEEELEDVSAMDMEQRSNLLDQVVNLARDLGRSHRRRGVCLCMCVCVLEKLMSTIWSDMYVLSIDLREVVITSFLEGCVKLF